MIVLHTQPERDKVCVYKLSLDNIVSTSISFDVIVSTNIKTAIFDRSFFLSQLLDRFLDLLSIESKLITFRWH